MSRKAKWKSRLVGLDKQNRFTDTSDSCSAPSVDQLNQLDLGHRDRRRADLEWGPWASFSE
jgi:hypothetical protein